MSHFLYCKTFNIWDIKFSRVNENVILAYFNFGGHVIPTHHVLHFYLRFERALHIILADLYFRDF